MSLKSAWDIAHAFLQDGTASRQDAVSKRRDLALVTPFLSWGLSTPKGGHPLVRLLQPFQMTDRTLDCVCRCACDLKDVVATLSCEWRQERNARSLGMTALAISQGYSSELSLDLVMNREDARGKKSSQERVAEPI